MCKRLSACGLAKKPDTEARLRHPNRSVATKRSSILPPQRLLPRPADIQGTAATALAGLYGALRVMGLPPAALGQQRIVCVGAGSAGMGVARMIASGACGVVSPGDMR